jgi:hypothetical protein
MPSNHARAPSNAWMRDPLLTAVLLILVATLIALPHLAGTPIRSRRQWGWVLATLVFLFWLLGGFGTIRA